jgi:hypothetical protein
MKVGFVPFWTEDGPNAATEARDFCKPRGLTSDQVKIVRRNGRVEIEVKRECQIVLSVEKGG